MTLGLKLRSIAVVGLAAACIAMSFAVATRANPLFFLVPTTSSSATTTPTYLGSAGQATSTPLDAYNTSSNQAFDGLSLLVQQVASTSASITNIRFQYAIQLGTANCVTTPNACDWYDDNFTPIGTTTNTVSLRPYVSFQLPGNASASTTTTIFKVQTPARYVRAIFTESGAAGSVWYAWQPTRQQP